MAIQSPSQPDNFSYEAAEGPRDVWPAGTPSITLRRVSTTEKVLWWTRVREEFELVEPLQYDDVDLGVRITVPRAGVPFRTDLTSVPAWFTWLVPKSGQHLPAALIHDGLVPDRGPTEPTYSTEPPTTIDRIDADRVFRDAMRDTGVGLIRRWLVWAAVSAASLVLGPRLGWAPWKRAYYAVLVVVWFAAIAYLGVCATADLADREGALLRDLPWVVEDDLWKALVTGLAGAVALPLLFSWLWLRWWKVGVIAGVALAALIHVTVAVGLVAAVYQVLEWVTRRAEPLALTIALGVVLASAAIFLGSVF